MKDTPMSYIETASVDMFTTLRSRLLRGQTLQDVKAMQASIARFGLLSPIVISRAQGRLIVVDGRKRLAAIKRLSFMGRLPRSLVNIPFIEVDIAQTKQSKTPALMSNRELYTTVTDMFTAHQDIDAIAADLFLPRESVRQVLTLAHLSPRLRRAFFDKVIDFSRAKAFATMPNHKAQELVFMALGPFADENEILNFGKTHNTPTAPAQRIRMIA